MRRLFFLFVGLLALGCNAPVGELAATVAPLRPTDSPNTQPLPTPTLAATTQPAPTATSLIDALPIIQPAPEIANDIWLNSEPLKLSDLRGKVVLVEFWTFG